MHIKHNGVARSHNPCWYGKATVLSLGTADVVMSLSKCDKYWKFCHGITVKRSVCGCASNVAVNEMRHSYTFMQNDRRFCQILTKYEFSQHCFVEVSNIKFGQHHPVVLVNH